jgi:hypothetical protein
VSLPAAGSASGYRFIIPGIVPAAGSGARQRGTVRPPGQRRLACLT